MALSARSFRLLIATLTLTAVASTSAQKGAAARMAAAPPASTITEASIRGHMEFLASDAMQGRGSGTADEWRAATYIASELRAWGIEPLGDDGGYVKTIDTGRTVAKTAPQLVAGGLTLTHGREMLVQSINKGAVKGPLFRYTYGVKVPAGSFVFVPDGATPANADIDGAAGVLTLETSALRAQWASTGMRMPTSQAPGGGRGARGGGAPPPAAVRIVLDRASHAAIGGMDDGTTIDFQCATEPGRTYNAIGKLTGSDRAQSAQVILLTAHLDHLGIRGNGPDVINNGADDDASGSTAVLELAEAISKSPRPKRTVIFAWFGSEEAGGFGARNFLDQPPVPLKQITANLEFEMIGRPDPKVPPDTLWLTGYRCSDLGAELAKQGARLVDDPHPEQSFFTRSDNIQLAYDGVIAHTVSSFNLHKQYHTPADDLSFIDFPYMTASIKSMYAPVMWLANSTFVPEWAKDGKPERGNRKDCTK